MKVRKDINMKWHSTQPLRAAQQMAQAALPPTLKNITAWQPMAIALTALMLVSMALTGCSDYDNGYSSGQLKFIKGFEDTFGEVDPSQDWNLATRGEVTVTTASAADIRIYAINPGGTTLLVAAYLGVEGTRTLGFDVEEGTELVIVSDGQEAYRTRMGGSVTFGDTDAESGTGSDAATRSHNVNGNLWYQDWVVPANVTEAEREKVLEAFSHQRKGAQNTAAVEWEDFWVQQVYKGHQLYTALDGTSVYSSDKMNQLIVRSILSSGNDSCYEHVNNFNTADNQTVYLDDKTSQPYVGTTLMTNMATDTGTEQFGYHNSADSKYHYDYIILQVDGSYYVGFDFYATVPEGQQDNTNMAVERDWVFNDWIVKISPAQKRKLDSLSELQASDLAPGWVLASEDFGGEGGDIDYNDVVFKVEHVSGQQQAAVTPLAAGGTLATYLFLGNRCLGEIHQLLGARPTVSGQYDPLNVGAAAAEASTFYVEVGADWSIASDHTQTGSMGGFSLKVLPLGSQAYGSTISLAQDGAATVPAPQVGEAPYILCVPASYTFYNYPSLNEKTTYDWAWPMEQRSIKSVYSGFEAWVKDHTQNTDWFQHPSGNGFVRRHTSTGTTTLVRPMTESEQTACGGGALRVELDDFEVTDEVEMQASDLHALVGSDDEEVKVKVGSVIDINDYIATSSDGALTYRAANPDVLYNVSGNYTDSRMQAALNPSTTTVTVRQAEGTAHLSGEITLRVRLLGDPLFGINNWQKVNLASTDRAVTLKGGSEAEANLQRNSNGTITAAITQNGTGTTITLNGTNLRIHAGNTPGRETITLDLAQEGNYTADSFTIEVTVTEGDQQGGSNNGQDSQGGNPSDDSDQQGGSDSGQDNQGGSLSGDYGTPLTIEGTIYSWNTFYYPIQTAALPTSGRVTITYVLETTEQWPWFNTPSKLLGVVHKQDAYNSWWEGTELVLNNTPATWSDTMPKRTSVSFTLDASAYAAYSHLSLSISTCGQMVGAYYR